MATNNAINLGTAASGKVLQGQGVGTASAFSTATYPATATSTGTILRADGTNWVATTSTYPNTNAVSTLLYASSANIMSALPTANSSVLTTNSTGVPSWKLFSVVSQVFTGNGTYTYTPTSGMQYCIVEVVGAGGGSGGIGATGATTFAGSGGGGGGGYSRLICSAATIGASQTVTIGAGGLAGTNTPGDGGQGGTSSLGVLITATGGLGGKNMTATGSAFVPRGGGGGAGASGNFNTTGAPGENGLASSATSFAFAYGGAGGSSFFGGGANNATSTAAAGASYGGGASGCSGNNAAAKAGAAGADGIVVITEYVYS